MTPRRSPYVERQIDQLLGCVDLESGGPILEMGCGMGRFTLPLLARGLAIVGLELSPGLLEELEEHRAEWNVPPLPLHCADMADPPAELIGGFDFVIGFFTLHHVHDLEACMRGVAACLRPGGRYAFIEPNPYNPLYYLQITFTPGMSWKADAGVLGMRRRRLEAAALAAGLVPGIHRRFGFLPPVISERGNLVQLDGLIEKVPPARPFLSFQIFTGARPVAIDGRSAG